MVWWATISFVRKYDMNDERSDNDTQKIRFFFSWTVANIFFRVFCLEPLRLVVGLCCIIYALKSFVFEVRNTVFRHRTLVWVKWLRTSNWDCEWFSRELKYYTCQRFDFYNSFLKYFSSMVCYVTWIKYILFMLYPIYIGYWSVIHFWRECEWKLSRA